MKKGVAIFFLMKEGEAPFSRSDIYGRWGRSRGGGWGGGGGIA